MKVLIACDKFKGSLTGLEACEAIARGLTAGAVEGGSVETRLMPVADGGEGMARAIGEACGGEWIDVQDVPDPLGRSVTAGYAWMAEEKAAAVEMSEASGLWRLAPEERDPWRASTRGTGVLIREALSRGARKILIGLGGSATDDGGSGLAQGVGTVFRDAQGAVLEDLPARLAEVVAISEDDLCFSRGEIEMVVASDVRNPLLGSQGCSRIYGPQKGVSEDAMEAHESRLEHYAEVVESHYRRSFRDQPGAGAAGGLGFGCLAFLGARIERGFDLVAEAIELDEAVSWSDLVITGEGHLDGQSLEGKAPVGVAERARAAGKPVAAFAGKVDPEAMSQFAYAVSIAREGLSLEENLKRGGEHLEITAREVLPALRSLLGGDGEG